MPLLIRPEMTSRHRLKASSLLIAVGWEGVVMFFVALIASVLVADPGGAAYYKQGVCQGLVGALAKVSASAVPAPLFRAHRSYLTFITSRTGVCSPLPDGASALAQP